MTSTCALEIPLTRTSPELGVTRRLTSLSVVVLPEPLRPNRTKVSPRFTCRLTRESTGVLSTRKLTSRNSMTGVVGSSGIPPSILEVAAGSKVTGLREVATRQASWESVQRPLDECASPVAVRCREHAHTSYPARRGLPHRRQCRVSLLPGFPWNRHPPTLS